MVYTGNSNYKVKFYRDSKKGNSPALEYIEKLNQKERTKILKYIEFLRLNNGYLDEPYSKHIKGKIRELRVDFGHNRHRIFYFAFVEKIIILLNGFLKKTEKTPLAEIIKAEAYLAVVLQNKKMYE